MPNNRNDSEKSYPLTAPFFPSRKFCATSDANNCVSMIKAKPADTIEPQRTARRPARPCSISLADAESPPLATFNTSAQATPSGYGKSELVTSARRSGIEYITPKIPPSAQIQNDVQNGKSVQ